MNHVAFFKNSKPMKRRKDYTPVRWDKYFQGEEDIKVGDDVCTDHFIIAILVSKTFMSSMLENMYVTPHIFSVEQHQEQ